MFFFSTCSKGWIVKTSSLRKELKYWGKLDIQGGCFSLLCVANEKSETSNRILLSLFPQKNLHHVFCNHTYNFFPEVGLILKDFFCIFKFLMITLTYFISILYCCVINYPNT